MSNYYYTSESQHGSSESVGFSDDTIVRVFESKKKRDQYVKEGTNISIKRIYRDQVTKNAVNVSTNGGTNAPTPYTTAYWGIDKKGDESFIDGQIGVVVSVCDENIYLYDEKELERFYK